MGLDISAYSKLVKIDVVFDADGEPIDPHTREPIEEPYFQAGVNYDFGPERYEGVEDKAVYRYDKYMGFRAGSYGGYNQWRQQLATLAGYQVHAAWRGEAQGMPFSELVNFSDCEGVLGAKVCAKLAQDFADWDERAQGDEWFYGRYCEWRMAMELAADGGAVDFH